MVTQKGKVEFTSTHGLDVYRFNFSTDMNQQHLLRRVGNKEKVVFDSRWLTIGTSTANRITPEAIAIPPTKAPGRRPASSPKITDF